MGLTWTVLGCSGTYAAPDNACSGYLVRAGGTNVWVDCGPGTLANLQHHVGLADVDAVVVTHEHPDHWLELPVLRNALKYGFERAGVALFGTAATRSRLDPLVDGEVEPTFDWHTIGDGDRFSVGSLSFECSQTDHPVETLALKVSAADDGASLVYSADTAAGWSADGFGSGIGLAVIEATLTAEQEGEAPHLSARQAGALARSLRARQLLITHLWPTGDTEAQRREAEASFGAPVLVAQPNATYEVSG